MKNSLQINKLNEINNQIYIKYSNKKLFDDIQSIIDRQELKYNVVKNMIKNLTNRYSMEKKAVSLIKKKNNKIIPTEKMINDVVIKLIDIKKENDDKKKIKKASDLLEKLEKKKNLKNALMKFKNNKKNINIYDHHSKLYKFVKNIEYHYYNGFLKDKTNHFTICLKNGDDKMFYSINFTSILKDGEYDFDYLYNLIQFLTNDPANFKEYVNKLNIQVRIEDLYSKQVLGSDQYNGYEIDFDYDIDFHYTEARFVNGDENNTKIFNQINIEKEINCCFYNSLLHYGIDDEKTKEIKGYNNIIKYLNELNINYKIYSDIFDIKKENIDLKKKTVYNNDIYYRVKIDYTILDCKKNIKDNDKTLIFALSHGQKVNHIFVPESKILFSSASLFKIYEYKNEKMEYLDKIKLNINLKRLIFFDLETPKNYNDKMNFIASSLSITYIDIIGNNFNKLNEEESIKILKNNCTFYIDYNLNVAEILLKKTETNAYNMFISFNGANFDNYFFLKSLRNNKIQCKISVHGGMIEIENSKMDKVLYKTFDLRRFLGPGSLEKHSQSYINNIEYRKEKKNELFKILDERYNNKTLFDDKEFLKNLENYNNIDVISMGLIMRSFIEVICKITDDTENKYEKMIYSCVSIPHFSYKYFNEFNKNLKNKPKKFKCKKDKELITEKDIVDYQFFTQMKTGGRCDMRRTVINIDDEDIIKNENIKKINNDDYINSSLDVASLYPFTMMCYNKSYFMSGDLIHTEKYMDNKTGIYRAKIKQNKSKNDDMTFYCEKSMNGNNWQNREEITTIITSHEVNHILKNKPHWDIEIINGYYTNNCIRGVDLFKSLLPFLKEKSLQDKRKLDEDICKKNKTIYDGIKYQPSIRETCKTIMNSLSGKFLQANKPFDHIIDENLNVIRVDKDNKKYEIECLKKDKMLHIGIFIYSLSKIFMYENMFEGMKEKDFVYTDTDSCKFVDKNIYNKWLVKHGNKKMINYIWSECLKMDLGYKLETKLLYNNIDIKCTGQFEDEYHGKNYIHSIYCDKKEYMSWNNEQYKIMLKGVNINNFIIINDNPDLIDTIDNIKNDKCESYLQIFYKNKNSLISFEEYENLNIEEKQLYKLHQNINDKVYNDVQFYDEMDKRLSKNDVHIVEKCKKLLLNKMKGIKTYIITCSFTKNKISQDIKREFIIKSL